MIDIPDFVFPKDNAGNSLCPKCRKLIKACDCPSIEPAKVNQDVFVPRVRLVKSGRRGKVVTVLEGLPRSEEYLKKYARDLKTKIGAGGTFYITEAYGVIEIQGNHRDAIREMIRK